LPGRACGEPVHVQAGHEATYNAAGLDRLQPFDATAVAAWRRGQVVFYGTPFRQVIAALNRDHLGPIIILNQP
jgi:transmembrane sensor